MQLQSKTIKLAEVGYRAKIAKQHLGKNCIFVNEPTAREFKNILKERLRQSTQTFKMLAKEGVIFSPYLEIGAEYSLRSSLLENKFGAVGFSSDISLPSLARSKEFAKLFNFKKTPKTICADAYNLPFKSNYFPFIFIYETLHHFPDPKPVLLEVKRVLAPGGICLIGAEPIRQSLQIRLWRRPNKLRRWEKALKFLLILPFISHIGKTEVEHGIIEEAFSFKTWQGALSVFDKGEVNIHVFNLSETQCMSPQKNWLVPTFAVKTLVELFGGGFEAILTKAETSQKYPKGIKQSLICPNCLSEKKIQVKLKTLKIKGLFCPNCKTNYGYYKNVLVLLKDDLKKAVLSAIKI